ncbi:acyltransferase, partial [Desulfobulbus sp. F4]|nr:acyltransferase [Desulfobulbus sp. F4]
MAQMDNGQWLPFELDGSGKHECGSSLASTAPFVQLQPEPNRTQYSVPKPYRVNNMNNNEWPRHLHALDVSRGVAALAVVLWHWQHFAYKGNSLSREFIGESQPLYGLLRLFYEKGGMGVQYFFLLSGFIFFWLYREAIKNGQTGAWEFIIHRFSRLYPLHFATLIMVAILQFFYILREDTSFVYPFNDVFHFLLNVCFASKWGFESGFSFNAPVWSVSIEILLYFIFFFVALFRYGSWLFCLFVSVSALIISYVVSHSILGGLAMFFLGGLVFHLTKFISCKYSIYKIYTYLVTILCWLFVIINYYVFDLSSMVLEVGILGKIFLTGFSLYILFPLTVLSLALIEIEKGPLLKPVSWIGNITYSSYLLHFPLQLLFSLAVSFRILDSN